MATQQFLDMIEDREDRDGIRLSWNSWPSTRVEATRMVIPIGALYTPLKDLGGPREVASDVYRCKESSCNGVLNSYW